MTRIISSGRVVQSGRVVAAGRALSSGRVVEPGDSYVAMELDLSALDLTTASNDAATRAALAAIGLSHSRSAATNASASVQTSSSTLVSGIGTGVRIGNRGVGRGLVVNRAVTNLVEARGFQVADGWSAGAMTRATGQSSPLGDIGALRITASALAQQGPYRAYTADGGTYTGSIWERSDVQSGFANFNQRMYLAYDGATPRLMGAKVPTTWIRRSDVGTPTAGTSYLVTSEFDYFDMLDLYIDLAQIESGRLAREVAVTTVAGGSVPGDYLQFADIADMIEANGAMSLYFSWLPIGASGEYPSGTIQIMKHASASVHVTMPGRTVTVIVGSSTFTFSEALPPWAEMEKVDIFLQFGGSSLKTNGHARVGENLIVSLGASSSPQGAMPTSGTFDFLCDGTSAQLDCLLQKVSNARPDWCPSAEVVTTPYRAVADGVVARVMPLGDSITEQNGAYRISLRASLVAASKSFVFVGSQDDSANLPSDPWHEGHTGYDIESYNGMRSHIRTWLREARPHVILHHIGTNNNGDDQATVNTNLESLLDDIKLYRPNSHTIQAEIIPIVGSTAWVEAYNTNLRASVDEKADAGMHIERVDCYDYYDTATDLIGDGIHPTSSGHAKNATVFYTALAKSIGPDEFDPENDPIFTDLGVTVIADWNPALGSEQWTKGTILDLGSGSSRNLTQPTLARRLSVVPDAFTNSDSHKLPGLYCAGDAGTPYAIAPDLTALIGSGIEIWYVLRAIAESGARAFGDWGVDSFDYDIYTDNVVYSNFGKASGYNQSNGGGITVYGTYPGAAGAVRPAWTSTRIIRITSTSSLWEYDVDNGLWGFRTATNTVGLHTAPTVASLRSGGNNFYGYIGRILLVVPDTSKHAAIYSRLSDRFK